MPGAYEWSKTQQSGGGNAPASGTTSAGGGAFATSTPAKKKGNTLLRLGGSLLSEVGGILGAPQQALFKGVRGVGQIAAGDFRKGAGSLASGAKSAAGFALPGSSMLVKRDTPITPTEALQPYGVKKLPWGADQTLQLVADPLNVATFGLGSVAKQGLKVAGKELGEKIATKGVRKGLSSYEKSMLKEALVKQAAAGGSRNAEKTAARQFKAMSARGQGGLGVRIPFTGVGAPIVKGTAVGSLGRVTGATAAKNAVKGTRPVKALARGLHPLANIKQARGEKAAEEVRDAKVRYLHEQATRAQDWDARSKAARADYNAQPGQTFADADEEFVHAVLVAGPEAMAAAKASRPELARVIDTDHAVRMEQAAEQRKRPELGLLETDEIRDIVTRERQAPVRSRIAARDAEIDNLNTVTDPPPAPASAAQERATGKLAERVRRREATVAGETARGERTMSRSAATIEKNQRAAAARQGQVMGRGRERMAEQHQLGRPSRGETQSRISRDSRLAAEKSAAENSTANKILGPHVDEQRKAVAKAQQRLAAAKTQEQETLARFDLENLSRAQRGVDKRVATLVERNIRDSDTLEQIARDVLDDPSVITDEKYLKRIMTEEGNRAYGRLQDEIKRTGGSVSSALKQASLKMRTMAREYTDTQINDAIDTIHRGEVVADQALADAVKGIAQKLNPGEKLYKESATLSLSVRGVEAAKAIAAADFVRTLRGIVGDDGHSILLSADDVAVLKEAGEELADDLVEFKIPKLGTFFAPKAVKDEIAGAGIRLNDPDALGKVFDDLNRWWKSQVTAALPGGLPFAARNARTNVMLMWLSGTNVPKYMREGLKLQRAVQRVYKAHAADVADLGVEAAMQRHLGFRDFTVWDHARKSGIIGDGFYAVDLGGGGAAAAKGEMAGRNAAVRGVKRAARFGFGTKGTLAVKGRAMNNAVEQHARLSQFLADVDRLGDLDAATRRTQDVLFDYSALTPTEQKIKRYSMSFYTFARKNIPGQVRRFVEAPGRFVLPEKLANAVTDPLPEGSPEYQERQGSRTVKKNFLTDALGLNGMVTKPERPLHAATGTLDPIYQLATGNGSLGLRGALSNYVSGVPGAPAKAMAEHATQHSLFTGYRLPKSARERQVMAAQTALPGALGRQPFGSYLPSATTNQTKRREVSTMAKALSLAGVGLQPMNKKEMARQSRLAKAAKRAERG